MDEYLHVSPIHNCREFILECCNLINSEWPRSKSARLQSLFMSSDKFPTSLVMILNDQKVVGHIKLSEINVGGSDVMIESVVIHKEHRGKGWGKMLMEDAEEYVRSQGKKTLYLSTKGQEGFYEKLGYEICKPILYLGFAFDLHQAEPNKVNEKEVASCPHVPPPPPLPPNKTNKTIFRDIKSSKTYMCKNVKGA